jgi:hypothetical protein
MSELHINSAQLVAPDAPYHLPVLQPGDEVDFFGQVQATDWQTFRAGKLEVFQTDNPELATFMWTNGQLASPYPERKELAETTSLLTYAMLGHAATAGPLPRVTMHTIKSFGSDTSDEESWQRLWDMAFERVRRRNPVLTDTMAAFMQASGALLPPEKAIVREQMTFTHTFLDLQATRDFTIQNGV